MDNASVANVDWYVDFVSPFAYLQLEQFDQLPPNVVVTAKPVVLGALLTHWQTKGPAEIPEKRRFVYRYAQFRAEQLGIPLRMPPAHPFNPIRLLRLALVLGSTLEVIRSIFRFVWRDGRAVESEAEWAELCARLGTFVTAEQLADATVKAALRENTDRAIAAGVFGVPTIVGANEIYWGEDALSMFLHCLRSPDWLRSEELRRISQLPVGLQRNAAS